MDDSSVLSEGGFHTPFQSGESSTFRETVGSRACGDVGPSSGPPPVFVQGKKAAALLQQKQKNAQELGPKEFQSVTFRSLPKHPFRVSILPMEGGSKTRLWAECKVTKAQWELKVEDLEEFAQNKDVQSKSHSTVFGLMAEALNACVPNPREAEIEEPEIDAVLHGGALQLRLTTYFSQTCFPVFAFLLQPLDVEDVPKLRSMLKDAFEEIASLRAEVEEIAATLKAEIAPVFLELSCDIHMASGSKFVWGGAAVNAVSDVSHFAINAGRDQITVRVSGFYRTEIRWNAQPQGCVVFQNNGEGFFNGLPTSSIQGPHSATHFGLLEAGQVISFQVEFGGHNCERNAKVMMTKIASPSSTFGKL